MGGLSFVCLSPAAFAHGHAEAGSDQPSRELVAVDERRAVSDQLRQDFFWHVIVVKIKPSSGDSVAPSEFMELIEIVVADQMCP